MVRSRWAALGAAVAIVLGAGGVGLSQATRSSGERPVYVALPAPCRLVDTRPDSQVGPKGTPVAAGDAAAYTIQVTGGSGRCTDALAVPADATAVAINVTAVAPVAPAGRSYLTVFPADADRPGTSNLNFLDGAPPTPNKVDVGLSAGGQVTIYNHDGTTHVAVDVFGYYTDHDHDDRYYTHAEVDALVAGARSTTEMTGTSGTIPIETSPLDVNPGTVVQTLLLEIPRAGSVTAHASMTIRGTEPGMIVRAGCSINLGDSADPVVDSATEVTVDVEYGQDVALSVVRGLHGFDDDVIVTLACRTHGGQIFPSVDPNSIEVRHATLAATFVPD